jgi:hypothetical protein
VPHPSSDIEADNTLTIRALDYCNERKKEREKARKKERKVILPYKEK